MNEYEVIIVPRAENDLRDIYEYIAFSLKAPEAALRPLFEKYLK